MYNPHTAPTRPVKINQHEETETIYHPRLKVMGLGGGGSNAIDRMLELGIEGVDFIVANTDIQALSQSKAPYKIQLGPKLTRGLGAGGNPEIGMQAAQESWKEIARALEGADMVFLTAGMGGGTGTGSIPVAAKIARNLGAVTIAIVTTPFTFEVGKRQQNARQGLKLLQKNTDTLIAIPNDRLLYVAPKDLPIDTAFRLADDILRQAVQAITELITTPGLINVDFAHVKRLMQLRGGALMAIGYGEGEGKAITAVKQALNHPLLESITIQDAAGIIASFTAGNDLTLIEVSQAINYLQEKSNPNAEIIMGATQDSRFENRAQATLIITGLGAVPLEEVIPGAEKATSIEPPSAELETIKPQKPSFNQSHINTDNLDIPAFLRRK